MRATEFIIEKKHQQVDEIIPVIGAAAGAIGRAAGTAGGALARGAMSAAGGVARGIGNAVGGVAQGIGNAVGGQQPQQPQQQQPAIPKPGGMYNHPTLGQIKVLPPSPGQKGLKLDTTQKLGFPILIDPNDMQS